MGKHHRSHNQQPKQNALSKSTHIMVATPCYGGSVTVPYVNSLVHEIAHLSSKGVVCSTRVVPGGPYVVQERNLAVREFLKTDCTHLMFIDADLGWDVGAVHRLLQHNLPIVGGLYPFKLPVENYPARICIHEGTNEPIISEHNLVKCDGIPTGFMLIQRQVIEDMVAFYPELVGELHDEPYYSLFDCLWHKNRWWGEDYIFCKRWMGMGGDVWADPNITFSHNGNFGFIGNWQDFLLRQLSQEKEKNNGNHSEDTGRTDGQ